MILSTRTCLRSVLLVIPLFLLCATLMATDNQPGEKITLNEKATPLKKVFNKITSQTGIKFVYSNRLIDDQQPVSVSVKEASLEEALQQIFIGRKFELQRTNPKSVVLIVHEKVVTEIAPVTKSNTVFDITGTVTDTAGASIPGATVLVRGTNKATATNAAGQFSLQGIDRNMILLVSSIGFQTQTIRLNNTGNINIKLSPAVNNLDESVIIAYNTTTRRDNVGAITVVKGEEIQALPSRSFDRSLQGLVPGLQITKGTGQPGGGISNMVIRGVSSGSDVSFGQTIRNPLIIIDGIPVTQDNFQFNPAQNATPVTNPLAQINPSDIETISVLKDAVAIALYGSKASNGVILVTTKRGKAGKTTFGFRHQTDIASKLIGKVEVLNQQEYLGLLYETYKNANPTQWTDQAILTDLKNKFPTRADGSFYPAPDWYDEIYADHATTVANEISMSGGNEKSNFYVNLEYTKQDGVVKRTGYDRKSIRFNFEHRPNSWLKVGFNSGLSYNTQDYANSSESATGYAIAMILSPLNPVRLEDGTYKFIYSQGATSSSTSNPVPAAEYNINKYTAYRGLNKLSGEARFLKYLTFSSILGMDFMLAESKEKNDPRLHTSSTPTRIAERNTRRTNIISTNTLRFDKTVNEDHVLNLIIGQEAQINSEKLQGAEATGTAETLPYYDQLTSAGYTLKGINASSSKQTLLSLFGQANYNYQNKYFLSSSLRRDGSSRFGDQQQWGTYWSVGAGWIVTAEKFMQQGVSWLNYLKLRGSIGAAGSSGAVDALTRFDKLVRLKYLNGLAIATLPPSPGNPDIRWEQTFTWDAGIEVRLLQQRVFITADIYKRKTQDLIYSTNLPSLSGFTTVMANIGDMENKGVEFSLVADIIKNKKFRWNFGGNWSTNKNVLVKANVPLAAVSGGLLGNEEGKNFNSFYMPVWAGVNPADGTPQWLDNTGKPTSNYSLAKKEFVGKPQPDGYGAINNTFSYKGFDLFAQLYYQYGTRIYDATLSSPLLNDGVTPLVNQVKQALDYWKKPGDIAANPRRKLNNTDKSNSISTRYLFKGDYIRLGAVSLAYTFPREVLEQVHISKLRVYVQCNNVAMLTNYPGPDPDNTNVGGSTKFGYPNQRSYSIGLNVNFQ